MRLLVIIGAGDFTGASKMGYYFARSFREQGHHVVVACGERPADGSASVAAALIDDGFAPLEAGDFHGNLSLRVLRRVFFWAKRQRVEAVVSLVQIDVKISAAVALLLQVPLVVSAQSMTTFYGSAGMIWIKRFVYSLCLQQARVIVCTSQRVREQYRVEHFKLGGRYDILPNGIDLDEYPEQATKPGALPDRMPGVPAFLNVARLDPQKGTHILVEAMDRLRRAGHPCQLYVVGGATSDSPAAHAYAKMIRDQVTALGLERLVVFLGWRRDVAALLPAVDAYVHASLWEGPPLPLALLEAMAARRPVVLTDCAGWPAGLRQGREGFVARAGDAQDLARQMAALLHYDPYQRAQSGAAARALVESRYDIRRVGEYFTKWVVDAEREIV